MLIFSSPFRKNLKSRRTKKVLTVPLATILRFSTIVHSTSLIVQFTSLLLNSALLTFLVWDGEQTSIGSRHANMLTNEKNKRGCPEFTSQQSADWLRWSLSMTYHACHIHNITDQSEIFYCIFIDQKGTHRSTGISFNITQRMARSNTSEQKWSR